MSIARQPVVPQNRLAFWCLVGGLLVGTASSLAVGVAFSLVWIATHPVHASSTLLHSPGMSALEGILGEAGMLFGAWFILRRRLPLASFGLARPRLLDVWLAFAVFATNLAFALIWTAGGQIGPSSQASMAQLWWHTGWAIPSLAITAGVCEEIVYRGYLLLGLMQLKPRLAWLWLPLSTAVFALAHSGWGIPSLAGFAPFAFFGLVAGLVVLLTRRLYPVIIGHAVWDAFVMTAMLHR